MLIFITTFGRVDNQITLRQIPAKFLSDTFLVVQEPEAKKHDYKRLVVLPKNLSERGLSPARQYVLDNSKDDMICLLDDDIQFYRQRGDKSVRATEDDMLFAFKTMEKWMERRSSTLFQSSFGTTWMNRYREESYRENTKPTQAIIFNRKLLRRVGFRFDCLSLKSDMHLALTMLQAGYRNRVSNEFLMSQAKGWNAEGGVSGYRNHQLLEDTARLFLLLHGTEHVNFCHYYFKNWKGLEQRLDITVRWKKAYEDAKKNGPRKVLCGMLRDKVATARSFGKVDVEEK